MSVMPGPKRRWNAVSDLLEYDESRGLMGRMYRRVVQITDQAGDLICSSHDDWPSDHDHVLAVQLQEAIDDRASVVRAIRPCTFSKAGRPRRSRERADVRR